MLTMTSKSFPSALSLLYTSRHRSVPPCQARITQRKGSDDENVYI